MEFKQEYMNEPPQIRPVTRFAESVAMRYLNGCEAYDESVCTHSIKLRSYDATISVPANSKEAAAIHKNSAKLRDVAVAEIANKFKLPLDQSCKLFANAVESIYRHWEESYAKKARSRAEASRKVSQGLDALPGRDEQP